MIIPNSDTKDSSVMEIETPNRYEETKAAAAAAVSVVVNNAAVAVSEGETGSEDSDESGNILFPSINKEAAEALAWPTPSETAAVNNNNNNNDDDYVFPDPLKRAAATISSLQDNIINSSNNSTALIPFDDNAADGQPSLSDFYANNNDGDANNNTPSTLPANQPQQPQQATMTIRLKRKRATGLSNLGNTCFMNSSLQCLAHTAPLREYFLSGEYKKDLNKDNPLGTGGELAEEFAGLLGEMWCEEKEVVKDDGVGGVDGGNQSTFNNNNNNNNTSSFYNNNNNNAAVTYPRSFKHTLGKYANQFIGYDQHDSQELAIYLLDALHEDTNRITKKPYVPKPEQGLNETDEEAADKAWNVHLQRENSKVFDYFMGQIKSKLQCTTTNCHRVSTTFDPSMYLSVPIPGSTDREMKVVYVPLDKRLGNAELTVKLCKNSTVAGLKRHVVDLARECYNGGGEGGGEGELLEEDIQLVDVFQDRIYAFYDDDHHIDKIKDSDVTYAYQLYPLASVKKEFAEYQQSLLQQKKMNNSGSSDKKEGGENNNETTTLHPLDFLLDAESRAKLDEGNEWENQLKRYVVGAGSLGVVRVLNEKRANHDDRAAFHDKITRFVTMCRQCPDCKLPGDDTIMEEKSDKEAEHNGILLPSSSTSSRINPNDAESADTRDLAEVCATSTSFQNVNGARDVGVLEYCAFKFKEFMDKVDDAAKELNLNENGFIVHVSLIKDGKKAPVVVRIPSTLTVTNLRSALANQLSAVLNGGKSASNISAEATIGDMTPEASIMSQTAMSFESKKKYSSYTTGEPLGSITEQHVKDGTSSFAKPCEDEEKALIAQVVDQEGTITLHIPARLNDYINEDTLTMSTPWLSDAQKIEKEKLQDDKVSVMDCISKFCQAEQLDENDMWYCNKCKQHCQAWKECRLYCTPPILVIHLKRFHYSAITHRRDKIDTFIDFPLNDLDLREYVTHWNEGEEPIYDCYAVSNHFGGLGAGHYTAYARSDGGSWNYFDDSRVTPVENESDVVSSAAYCLYYKRRDVVVPQGKEVQEVIQESIKPDNEMEQLGSPSAFKPASILSDVSSTGAQVMDVDERSGTISEASVTWPEGNLTDDDRDISSINDRVIMDQPDQTYNYPLQ